MAKRRTYDEQTRGQAVALAVEVGPAEAARRLGIKATTLRSWCSRAGVATDAAANTSAAAAVKRAQWEERRATMVHEIGETAHNALIRVGAAIADGSPSDAKNYATTMAILVDKAQLLSGGSTARFGTEAQRAHVLEEAHDRALSLVRDSA
jgi:transposase-like protein